MKKLYKFNVHCGRMGDLEGIFVAEEKDVKASLGRAVYFGEVLGKHSEVEVELEEEHFQVLTDDQSFIEKFEKLGCSSGMSPFDYLDRE